MPLLRLGPSAAAKEKRLASLLGGRDISGLGLAEAVRDAQVLGSLDLAGETTNLEEVRAARNGRASPAAAAGLVRAAPGGGAPPHAPAFRRGDGARAAPRPPPSEGAGRRPPADPRRRRRTPDRGLPAGGLSALDRAPHEPPRRGLGARARRHDPGADRPRGLTFGAAATLPANPPSRAR